MTVRVHRNVRSEENRSRGRRSDPNLLIRRGQVATRGGSQTWSQDASGVPFWTGEMVKPTRKAGSRCSSCQCRGRPSQHLRRWSFTSAARCLRCQASSHRDVDCRLEVRRNPLVRETRLLCAQREADTGVVPQKRFVGLESETKMVELTFPFVHLHENSLREPFVVAQ